jgi:hypothetical protein
MAETATTSTPYVPPELCIGTWTLQNDCTKLDEKTIENQVAESIEIAGAPINVFKLLGVHEQGRLVDLTGQGYPLSSGAGAGSDASNAFDISSTSWHSAQVGPNVVAIPAYLGYNFGSVKSASNGVPQNAPPAKLSHHITTLKIQQGPLAQNRALQVRIDRATGELKASNTFIGSGNGLLVNIQPGFNPSECTILVTALTPTSFSVFSSIRGPQPNATVGVHYANQDVRFTIQPGSIPFSVGDTFTIKLELNWLRVDIVNLPNSANVETIAIRPSVPSPFWRIVPLLFNGGATDYWEVVKLELIDYQSTNINNIQDTLFLENRDRDYAQNSITLKCQYQPFDSIGDLGKFGFSILDQYVFVCSFARMVQLLGRPIVVGDVLEVTPELAYDQNLMPVKKFLEVTDAGWSADGYSPQWKPMLYRFQAIQLIPSIEVRDILPMPQEALQRVSDGSFFESINQIETTSFQASETTKVESQAAVPETGEDITGLDVKIPEPWADKIAPTQTGMYVENGLPPNGEPYGEGYRLPDVASSTDGEYYRLNYEASTNIPPRLYKFSAIKNRWLFVEQDRRSEYSSHKPSVRNALISLGRKSLQDTNL